MIQNYRRGIRIPIVDEYTQDGNNYRKIADNGRRLMYEVTQQYGTKYWEVFEHGHRYKVANPKIVSRTINDGDEMYPMDEDFGSWAWCFSNYDRAVQCFNYTPPVTVDAD